MKLIDILKNAFRQFKNNFLWSLFMGFLFAVIVLLSVNFFTLLSRRDVFFKTVNFLNEIEANMIRVDLLPRKDSTYAEDNEIEESIASFFQKLSTTNKLGTIMYIDDDVLMNLSAQGYALNTSQFEDFSNVVILFGKYIDFADLSTSTDTSSEFALVSPDCSSKLGQSISFLNTDYKILDTLDYSYPDNALRNYFKTDENVESKKGLNESTLFLITNNFETLEKIYGPAYLIEQLYIFGDVDQEYNRLNEELSEYGSAYAKLIPIADFFKQAPDANPIRLKVEIAIIFIALVFISFILALNYFRNQKAAFDLYQIHQTFGANNKAIFVWILSYTFMYFVMAMLLTFLLLAITYKYLLRIKFIFLIIFIYFIVVFILSTIAYKLYSNTSK